MRLSPPSNVCGPYGPKSHFTFLPRSPCASGLSIRIMLLLTLLITVIYKSTTTVSPRSSFHAGLSRAPSWRSVEARSCPVGGCNAPPHSIYLDGSHEAGRKPCWRPPSVVLTCCYQKRGTPYTPSPIRLFYLLFLEVLALWLGQVPARTWRAY